MGDKTDIYKKYIIYICNSSSKNRMSLLGSKAQEEVLSEVEPRRESKKGRDCLRLSEIRKKKKIVDETR